jgi:hypothetical protein
MTIGIFKEWLVKYSFVQKMGEVLILKKILDPQIYRGLSSINKTKKYKYLTLFIKMSVIV